jgi:hypothetical protein
MQCYTHQNVEAVAICVSRGRGICRPCAVDVAGKIYCQPSLALGSVASRGATANRPTSPLAILSLIVAILGLVG